MSFDEKQYEMIFGLHEDGIVDTFGGKTFDLTGTYTSEARTLDACLMGVSRRNASAVEGFVPLVTYGITVKKVPEQHNHYASLMDIRGQSNLHEPRIAVYKQRKVDNNLKEYFVLSIGVSGEVFKGDLISNLVTRLGLINQNVIDLTTVLQNASYRNYTDKINNMVVDPEHFNNSILVGLSTPFTFIRDGVKKPGYFGPAHIGAVYVLPISLENEVSYNDTNCVHMGWFTLEELRTVVAAQEGMAAVGQPITPETFGFANPGYQQRLGQLVLVNFEPWSERLIMDSTDEFENLLRHAPSSTDF
jgi:hypothetical protein